MSDEPNEGDRSSYICDEASMSALALVLYSLVPLAAVVAALLTITHCAMQ